MPPDPLSELTITAVDAREPGRITLTLDEKLCCPGCGRTGDQWVISLTATRVPPQTSRNRRVEDPGG